MAILELVTVSPERPKKVGNRKSSLRLAEFKFGGDRKAAKKDAETAAVATEEPSAEAAEESTTPDSDAAPEESDEAGDNEKS